MPIDESELISDLPDAIRLYAAIKAALKALPTPPTYEAIGGALAAVLPLIGALADKLKAQAQS